MVLISHYKNNKKREIFAQFYDMKKEYYALVENVGDNKKIELNDLISVFGNFYKVSAITTKDDKIRVDLKLLSRGVA